MRKLLGAGTPVHLSKKVEKSHRGALEKVGLLRCAYGATDDLTPERVRDLVFRTHERRPSGGTHAAPRAACVSHAPPNHRGMGVCCLRGRPRRTTRVAGGSKRTDTEIPNMFAVATRLSIVRFSPRSRLCQYFSEVPATSAHSACVRSRSTRSSAIRRPTSRRTRAGSSRRTQRRCRQRLVHKTYRWGTLIG